MSQEFINWLENKIDISIEEFQEMEELDQQVLIYRFENLTQEIELNIDIETLI